MLPEIDGLEVAKAIRKTSSVPIIMLSAKDSEFGQGYWFEPDDYVTKPLVSCGAVSRFWLRRTDLVSVDSQESDEKKPATSGQGLEIVPDAYVQKYGEELGFDPP